MPLASTAFRLSTSSFAEVKDPAEAAMDNLAKAASGSPLPGQAEPKNGQVCPDDDVQLLDANATYVLSPHGNDQIKSIVVSANRQIEKLRDILKDGVAVSLESPVSDIRQVMT
jgi:hypothetical protein